MLHFPKLYILVLGSKGQVGRAVLDLGETYTKTYFYKSDKINPDITDKGALKAFLMNNKVNFIINCAAYTKVDMAETERESAYQINGYALEYIARLCEDFNVTLIHISTDYVFDGTGTEPYTEDMVTKPLNVYGQSKRLGECMALRHNSKTLVIRTSWVYSDTGHNFVRTMQKLLRIQNPVSVVADQFGNPTSAYDLAGAILYLIHRADIYHFYGQIFHYTNSGGISWYDFAVGIQQLIGTKTLIIPIATNAYVTSAVRPKYSVLSTVKWGKNFSYPIKKWQDSLLKVIEKIKCNEGA